MSQKDNRIKILVELTQYQFYTLAKMAHEQDVTFNEMCEILLTNNVERYERGELTFEDEEEQDQDRES